MFPLANNNSESCEYAQVDCESSNKATGGKEAAYHTLIEAEAAVSEYIPTSEIRCKQSEIDRAIDNGTKTAEEIRSDIFRLAELKYKHFTYSDVNQKTELLKSLIDNRNQLNTLDIGLLRSCVKRITVSHSCVIEAEFINGVIIKNKTERSDDNGSGSKCKDNPCQATSN